MFQLGLRIAFLAGVTGVATLSLTPQEALPLHPNIWDKAQHLLAYGVLGLIGGSGYPGRRNLALLGGGLVLLGCLLEIGQLPVPGRTGSVGDAFANMLGAGLGLFLAQVGRSAGRWVLRPTR